jgi:DNA polymerase III subunit chi
MTERVDFYVLKSAAAKQRWAFACRLIEKAYLLNLKVLVLHDTLADAQALDELLWTFNERSFVPHTLCKQGQSMDLGTPVHLAVHTAAEPGAAATGADLLINLALPMPTDLQRFARIAEIIDADEEHRRSGRERFKAYRDLKLTMETHQLDETADA